MTYEFQIEVNLELNVWLELEIFKKISFEQIKKITIKKIRIAIALLILAPPNQSNQDNTWVYELKIYSNKIKAPILISSKPVKI